MRIRRLGESGPGHSRDKTDRLLLYRCRLKKKLPALVEAETKTSTAYRTTFITHISTAAADVGRNPVRKHQIQPGYGDNEQADAGRDGRTGLARPTSQAQTGTGKEKTNS